MLRKIFKKLCSTVVNGIPDHSLVQGRQTVSNGCPLAASNQYHTKHLVISLRTKQLNALLS